MRVRAAACCEIDDDVVAPTERHFCRKSRFSRPSCDEVRSDRRVADPTVNARFIFGRSSDVLAAAAKSSAAHFWIGRVAVAAASSSFVFVDALHAW